MDPYSTHPARRPILSAINKPIHFAEGQFAGNVVRAEVREIQKAEVGRKYARVDRRPLDPPPSVQLKLFYVFHQGTEHEYEREVDDYRQISNLGLLCNVDLFPVPSTYVPTENDSSVPRPASPPSAPMSSHGGPSTSQHAYVPPPPPPLGQPSHPVGLFHPPHPNTLAQPALPPLTVPDRPLAGSSMPPVPALNVPSNTYPQAPGQQQREPLPEVIAYLGPHLITEPMKCTHALSGTTFVQPVLMELEGKPSLVFAFSDLAVKSEGVFFLRYRYFDLFGRASAYDDLPVQAECFGGLFRVYSTKEFPGLPLSTELTKSLAKVGVKANLRTKPRKRVSGSSARSAKTREGHARDAHDRYTRSSSYGTGSSAGRQESEVGSDSE